jgi:release factor glutamine methyltransferase
MSRQVEIWTVRDVLNWTSQKFADLRLPTPLLDAQLLIGSVLSLSKVEIYTQLDRPLIETERSALRELVRRRLSGEPVAYLLCQKFWHDLDLYVDSRVLVPRPETETLLDLVLAVCRHENRQPRRILDICTGSGCLALALAKVFPAAEVIGIDLSADALEVASLNAERNKISTVKWVQGDALNLEMYEQLGNKCFDIVVSNPPYVSESEWSECDPSVKQFEPKMALIGGEQGWLFPRRLLETLNVAGVLSDSSIVGLELGLSHPEILGEEIKSSCGFDFVSPMISVACQRPVWEFPRNQWFSVKDYSQRSRFLFGMRSSGVKDLQP